MNGSMLSTDYCIQTDLIYDVGMHKGEDTDYYLKRGYRVVGFEANPDLVRENREHFARAIAENRLVIVEGAIVDDPSVEAVRFYVNEDSSVWGTTDADFAERNEQLGTRNRVVEVKAIDFVSCLTRYGVPYYMKIDIEGADMFCLEALKQFKAKPSYISVESDKVDFERLQREVEMLDSLGYRSFKAVQQADVPRMKIPSHSTQGKILENHQFAREGSGLFGSDLPGKWISREELIREYEHIFTLYRRFGDNTFWQKNYLARTLLKAFSRMTGKHYPGWYDTHARHESVAAQD